MPDIEDILDQAYAQVVAQVLQTPTDIHVNLVLDEPTMSAVIALQASLAEQGARSNRSEAMRLIMREGITALLYKSIDAEDYQAMKAAAGQRAQAILAEGRVTA